MQLCNHSHCIYVIQQPHAGNDDMMKYYKKAGLKLVDLHANIFGQQRQLGIFFVINLIVSSYSVASSRSF